MVQFKQKNFTEYDAMRSLYVELMKNARGDKNRYNIIDQNSLIPVLRGNNVVIERFVISTSFGHRDKYRMYIKVGAKAKMPDEVRLPSYYKTERIGTANVEFNGSTWSDPRINNANYDDVWRDKLRDKRYSEVPFGNGYRLRLFGDDRYHPDIKSSFAPNINLSYDVKEILGDAVKYNKKERSLVLEFNTIQDAVRALDILPFGLDYKIYLLNL